MMRYHNYHKHDYYSNIRSLDCVCSPMEYIDRAKELDGDNAILFTTNHGYQGNVHDYYTLAKANNIKLMVGVETYYVPNRLEKDKSNYHLVIIAKNNEGYKQINDIISEANISGYYYKPRIDDELLFSLNPNDVIITTACVASRLKDIEGAEEWIIRMKEYFRDSFYLEVQNHNEEIQKKYNRRLLTYAAKYNIEIIHANDSHYIYPEDVKYRDLFLKAKGITYEDESNFILDYPSYDEIVDRYKKQGILSEEQIKRALENTLIFDNCEGIVINDNIKLPSLSKNPNKELREILDKELNKLSEKDYQIYKKAIDYEFDIIEKTNMEDYFIIDYRIVERGINTYNGLLTKSGRGSAPSFAINKFLGLTEIDRLKAPVPLFPTRFMSTERILSTKSLPDIDLNTENAQPFIQATEDLLGKENCAWLITFKPLQRASAFRLYCKALDMKVSEYDEVAKNLDIYENDVDWKDIIKESNRFVGVIESISPSPCFVEGTLVLTDNGYKEIQDIKTGDYVLTHKNRYQKVETPMKKKTDSILELKIMGSEIIKVTKEHPFYIVSRCGRKYTKNKETNKYESVRKFTEPYWKNAEDLTKGDFIGYPVNNNSIIPRFKVEKYINKFSKQIVEELDFTNRNLWWLIGRYLGDGWTRFQKDKNGNVSSYNVIICCNKKNNEKNEIESYLKGLFNYHIYEEKTVYKIVISNKSLYMYLQKFGKYAHGKFIPNEVIDLPINLLRCFLEGYFSADGYKNEERGYQSCTSVSKKLILGIQQCVHKAYKQPTTLVKVKPSRSIIDGRKIVGKYDVYILSYFFRSKFTQGFYKDNYMWQPFREYKEEKYNGYVYNMSVDKDESYTINNMAVHNCSMLLYNKPVRKEIGLIKTKDGICCNLDGYSTDKYKYVKNDLLTVRVWSLIRKTCELANIKIPTINELNEKLDKKTFDIYEKGLTCTINQVDSDFATGLVKEYKPKNIAEMSAFVAAIRPGFASLLDNFIRRKPYTTGVKELDNVLNDSYHYLIYQESIMKYLMWLGVPESETYTIIKKISKKKFKEKELIELKEELIEGWNKVVGKKEGFEETWKVVEDASRYSFNASHSLSYAYDSLYGAYLKSHYPLEYYTAALNNYDGDEVRTVKLTKEMDYFKIKLKSPKFRFSRAEYFMDKKTNSIYKGVASIKYLNKDVGEYLYSLKDNKYESFTDLLIDINKHINSKQLTILIKLNFFSEFGKSKKLLKVYENFDNFYSKSQIKKDKYPMLEDLFKQYSSKETEKLFKFDDTLPLLKHLESGIKNESIDIIEEIISNFEYIGSCNVKDSSIKKNYLVLDIELKYTPRVLLYSLVTGKQQWVKVKKSIYKNNPLNIYDMIYLNDWEKKNKRKKVDGEWVKSDEMELYLIDYFVVISKEG